MRTKIITLAVVILLVSTLNVSAQNYQLHSVFIYSFTKYIQWPPNYSKGDFEIGILGDSEITPFLEKMASTKKAGDQRIKINKFSSVDAVSRCHMIFIADSMSGYLRDVLQKLGQSSTLIITEKPGMAKMGSGINFVEKKGKLAFELNKSSLNQNNLKASSELTRLAIVI